MILHPAIIALLLGSLMVTMMALYASWYGFRIIRSWDLQSGSESQIALEKKTYLISTVMTYAFFFVILSFFLFIFTAEDLHGLFVGAMCAAGSLNVNGYGYPALILKIIVCILAGVWLILNQVDNRAYDYPLIKKKYALLLGITPFILAETVVQAAYFINMEANVITSCCGSLFSAEKTGIGSGLAAFAPKPTMVVFFASMLVTFFLGLYYYLKGSRTGVLFSLSSVVTFCVSVVALISCISLYYYELPTHHCPFCILQVEYHFSGYLLYVTLLGGVIFGAGVGILAPFGAVPSLAGILPEIRRGHAKKTLILYGVFLVLVIYEMITSQLTLFSL